jgi:hypothetical protein
MRKTLLVQYFNEITNLHIRESVCNRSLYTEGISFFSGIEVSIFRTHGQRAHRIDIRGIRLEIAHLIAKASNLLRIIMFYEPSNETVKQIQQGLIRVCLSILVVLKDELEAYLNANQRSLSNSLTPESQANAEAIGWNNELYKLFSDAHDILVNL